MTTRASTWPQPAATERQKIVDRIAFGLGLLILLTYSEAWVTPLIGDSVDDQSSSLVRDLYFPAYFAGLVMIAMRPLDVLMGMARQPFMVLTLIVAGASVAWSVAPDLTLRREIALVFTTLGGAVLGARWRWPTLVEVVATAFAILALVSLFAGIFLPTVGRMTELFPGAWRGLWSEKNTFAGMMVFAFMAFGAAALLRRERAVLWWSMAVLAVALVLLSRSKTSLVALILGMAALSFVVLVRRGGAVAVITVYFGVVGAGALAAAILISPTVFLELLGKDATLTGRTQIWTAVLRVIHQRPWLGYGYAAVWTAPPGVGPLAAIVKEAGYRPEHAHNGWLEQWLGMGLIGLGVWAFYFFINLIQSIWAVFFRRGALYAFPFLVVYALMILTDSLPVLYNDLRWVLFVMVGVRLSLGEWRSVSDHVGVKRGAEQAHGQVAHGQRSPFGQPQGPQHWPPHLPQR